LYGTTAFGGFYGDGTVFSITPNGAFTTLAWFDGLNGATPEAPLVFGLGGALYGTTLYGGLNDFGTIFRIDTPGTAPLYLSISETNGVCLITWPTVAGRNYQLQSSSDLVHWNSLVGPLTGSGAIAQVHDSVAASSQRFYRLLLMP
jgi:uncharacterized repeat protein (TIGR03803 family)